MRRAGIINRIASVLREIAPDASVWLYGSEARGEAREDSDIDILVVLPDASDRSFAERKIEIFDRLYGIELENNVSVSPLVVLKSIWERMRTPFTINVANEGLIL